MDTLRFVLTNVLMISTGILLFLIIRAIPRVEETSGREKKSILEKWINSELPEKMDAAFQKSSLKILRKFKVLVLKADNAVSKRLEAVKTDPTREKSSKPIDILDTKEDSDEDNRNYS